MTAAAAFRSDDLQGKRFLIVEDKFLVADELQRIVTAAGGEVAGPTSSVAEAKALIAASGLDLALLDIDLAGQDVFEVVAALEAGSVPFIFVTGFDPAHLGEAYSAYAFVRKPFTSARITQAILRRLA